MMAIEFSLQKIIKSLSSGTAEPDYLLSTSKPETDIIITSEETATRATVTLRLRSDSEQWSA